MLPLLAATSVEHTGPQCLLTLARSLNPPPPPPPPPPPRISVLGLGVGVNPERGREDARTHSKLRVKGVYVTGGNSIDADAATFSGGLTLSPAEDVLAADQRTDAKKRQGSTHLEYRYKRFIGYPTRYRLHVSSSIAHLYWVWCRASELGCQARVNPWQKTSSPQTKAQTLREDKEKLTRGGPPAAQTQGSDSYL